MKSDLKKIITAVLFIVTTLYAEQFDLLIKNGRVMDGTGNPWFYANIGIKNGKVVYVGRKVEKMNAKRSLDATGLTVAPGFIDIHSHAYDSFRSFPDERISGGDFDAKREKKLRPGKNMVAQGVTTLVTNQDGRSGWPISDQINKLNQGGFGPNIILMVGHGAIRFLAMGEDYKRETTPQEIKEMKTLLKQGMEEGASGMSAGLEYVPGRWSNTKEMIEVVEVLKEYDGVFVEHERGSGEGPMWWYPSSSEPKGQAGILESVNETIKIAEATGVNCVCTHIKARGADFWGASAGAVNLIERARNRGVNIWADQYPYNTSGSDGNTRLIPSWVRGKDEKKGLKRIIANGDSLEILKADITFEITRRGGPENIVVMDHPAKKYIGKTFQELAKGMKKNPVEVAIQLALEGDKNIRGGGRLRGFSMSEVDVETYAAQPWVMTASDGGLALPEDGFVHARFYGTFPRKIKKYAMERSVLSVENAIRSMTSMPALVLGLKDRGVVREGNMADLVIMDLERIRDTATFFDPHQYPEGLEYVLVSGKFVVDGGEPTGSLPGKIITTWRE
ncbi:MAG: amidohydrolase family protein [Candidatus Marinimicrobia bacterium]|jgi:N-acyl-D-amino-acid deacylase|nr:amidohydrolase family protein [Candidatus Neomarinimicrobiota bacterium]MDP6569298.1 amidohydrolase family protein [Candidatus Neomarinimicrobiota bacterium]MDP7060856.1 amidohydrolase family protein [Candidatus Neomarinimicrobiota bacterium]|tara:strand:- start:1161 stop:2846 length:1686 start_codon:yes stop_codon:yes gene_type:complete